MVYLMVLSDAQRKTERLEEGSDMAGRGISFYQTTTKGLSEKVTFGRSPKGMRK